MSSIDIRLIGITDLDTDCIVNAANRHLAQGSGVCGAIFHAAGALIAEEAGASVFTIDGEKLQFIRPDKSSVIAGSIKCIKESNLIQWKTKTA